MTTTGRTIDREALARLRRDVRDPAVLARLVRTFSSQTAPRLAELRAAAEAGDAARAREVAHWIKGGAASLAAIGVAALCGEIEAAARDGELGRLPPLMDELEACFERTRGELEAELA